MYKPLVGGLRLRLKPFIINIFVVGGLRLRLMDIYLPTTAGFLVFNGGVSMATSESRVLPSPTIGRLRATSIGFPIAEGNPFSDGERQRMAQLIRVLGKRQGRICGGADSYPYRGLYDITTGELLAMSPIERLAFMMTQTHLKKFTKELLQSRHGRELNDLLRSFTRNIALELTLNGREGSEDHLTRQECNLLRNLIGVREDGTVQRPKTSLDLSGNKEREIKLVEEEIVPLIRKIRIEYGGEIVDFIETVRVWSGVLIAEV